LYIRVYIFRLRKYTIPDLVLCEKKGGNREWRAFSRVRGDAGRSAALVGFNMGTSASVGNEITPRVFFFQNAALPVFYVFL
jgi:hypothetical protein